MIAGLEVARKAVVCEGHNDPLPQKCGSVNIITKVPLEGYILLDNYFVIRLYHTILTDDLSIMTVVLGDGQAFLNINTTSVAASWLPLWGLPTLAGCVHDATGVVMGATGQAFLLPLAEHLAGMHTWVPLPHN